jgi:ABC-2 type transport system permease protein
VSRALAELLLRSLRGRFLRWARQLKQPRYLIAFLAGLAYFGLMLGPRVLTSGFGGPRKLVSLRYHPAEAAGYLEPLSLVTGFGVALVLSLVWLFASAKPSLPLTEAEVHLLLPAPLTRRQVFTFALVRAQVGILVGSFFLALFTSGGHPVDRMMRWAAAWGLFSLFDLHNRGVQLWKARNRELPAARAALRRALALAVALGFWGALGVFFWRAWTAVGGWEAFTSGGLETHFKELVLRLRAGPFDEFLYPFSRLTAPMLGAYAWSSALVLAVALWGHWEWVVRSAARFEDATVERARRQAARGARRRPGYERSSVRSRERQPFALRAGGPPEMAIYWKNLLAVSRSPMRQRFAWVAGIGAVAFALTHYFHPPAGVYYSLTMAGAVVTGVFPVLAGLMMRNDLRSDLLNLEILRPWPIRGWRLVAAELLAPATSALQMVAVGLVLLTVGLLGPPGRAIFPAAVLPSPAAIPLLLVSAVLLAVPITLTSVAVHNVAVLALPSWIPLGPQRRRGAALTGQQMLLFLGHALAMALAAGGRHRPRPDGARDRLERLGGAAAGADRQPLLLARRLPAGAGGRGALGAPRPVAGAAGRRGMRVGRAALQCITTTGFTTSPLAGAAAAWPISSNG